MNYFYDQRWCGQHGIGRFASEIGKQLTDFRDIPLATKPLAARDGVALSKFLRRNQAKLYVSPGFNVPWKLSCNVVVSIHDMIHVHFPKETSIAKAAYYRLIQRPVVRRSALTLTVSQYSRREIVQWYGIDEERVVVVGNGISESFTAAGPRFSHPRPYILYVGAIRPHKNVECLLQAIKRLDATMTPDLLLVCRPTAELKQWIVEAGLTARTTILSGIDDTQLASVYRGAECLVFPSLYEGFGLPAVEAMACGCPTLLSDRTSLPEIGGDAAIYFDAASVDDLRDHLHRFLAGAVDRDGMIKRGLQQASQYSWEAARRKVRDSLVQANLLPA
ncbi:glycosyl transferase group 1 family protein [Rhodopirellula maiorica SM1]|uniref:Glycosyl transferase group 1 family protein n=1 Tax=Rhodopirellula maiorica SM1 TaxID=1265738 RepID=M5RTV4_9BACT|nr:glycosyltransferase family 1 protein [Rhodopirellula maiorica]EMI17394.1 glycosyl transferase group 1 family protein [Rhodopirellula maiorica SM1]